MSDTRTWRVRAGIVEAVTSGERFEPTQCVAFRSRGWQHNEATGLVECFYALHFASGETIELTESYLFPTVNRTWGDPERVVLGRLLDHLCLVASLSYYKLAAPPKVVVEHGRWSDADLAYHRGLLSNGLGEFCWENKLPLLDPEWTMPENGSGDGETGIPVPLDLRNGPLVPVGGGKDSCVSIEAMRSAGFAPTLVTVRRFPVIQDVIDAAALPDVAVSRVLDPSLGTLVERGALNGHVPVTAIVTWASLVAALVGGHDAVVLSNERSASAGNVVYRGVEINHQWSKSAEAETLLSAALARITPSLRAFSLLRAMSELSIARRFATTGHRYFSTFSSCNGAFRIDPARRVDRWDGTCAKCQFVFLALATVLNRSEVELIWGVDVFSVSPFAGFEALLGLTDWKPFECVGESSECRVALAILSKRSDWATHSVIRSLIELVKSAGLWPTAHDEAHFFSLDPISFPVPYDRVKLS